MSRQRKTRTLTVILNGTNENPYHQFGLTQNPFPQIGDYRYSAACLRMQALEGDPIPYDPENPMVHRTYIREKLRGFDPAFVESVADKFQPGVTVRLDITFPEDD
jgi:hypothetical protein